jgi:MOSC domain-containing protein YiiM
MSQVSALTLVAEKGIKEDRRYSGRRSRSTGRPSRRQVTLIGREVIAEHAATLGLPTIAPGAVRSNIETSGHDLMQWMGEEIALGTAVVRFYEPRTPCRQMDDLCPGLRALMENGRQGVLAEVIASGIVRVGDPVRPAQRK